MKLHLVEMSVSTVTNRTQISDDRCDLISAMIEKKCAEFESQLQRDLDYQFGKITKVVVSA